MGSSLEPDDGRLASDLHVPDDHVKGQSREEQAPSSSEPSDTAPTPKKRRGRPPKEHLLREMPLIVGGSDKHDSLQSFLDYAQKIDLDRASTVFSGTHYEYTVIETLTKFKFDLTRTGRGSDRGIDLLGQWNLPETPGGLRVLVQCKLQTGTNKAGPSLIRELEGAFQGTPSGWRGTGTMALLASTREATKGIREAMTRSRWPMGFLNVTPDGSVQQFLWNHSATEKGLEGMGAVSYTHLTLPTKRIV